MRGLLRFLLGSILGAALGILIAERRQRKVARPRGLPLYEGGVGSEGVPPLAGDEGLGSATAGPGPAVAEVPEPASAPESPAPEPAAAAEAAAAESVEPGIPEPEAITAAVSEAVIGEAMMDEPDLDAFDSGFEVVVAPELLEEPIPGTGWQSSLEPLGEEDVKEPFVIPVEKEAAAPDQADALSRPPSNGSGMAAESVTGVSVDDLRARIEETRRRIRMELDQPFLTEAEMTRFAAPGREQPAEDLTQPEAEDGEQEAGSEEGALEPQAGADELGEPRTESPVADQDEPAEEKVLSHEAGATAATASPRPTVAVPVDEELAAEYDAIKARIQETRSRLKAKAFDAMMTGESALLGRESGEQPLGPPEVPKIDEEVEQSIERGLREEEV